MKTFYHLLGNTLIANITNMTVWFGITYFSFLETQSVLATSITAGIYLITVALSGFWIGGLVDHNKKKPLLFLSGLVSLTLYSAAFVFYLVVGRDAFGDVGSPILWIFVTTLLFGAIAGNVRTIALPTIITILVPEERRDRANGLAGTITGIGFLMVSVISGLLVGLAGMYYVLMFAIVMTIITMLHVLTISIPEREVVHTDAHVAPKLDIKGTILIITAIPGLFTLIAFSTFNNFLGGVFMALMDAYGLSLVSVQTWGLLWGFLSLGFIVGGLFIAKFGLGTNPLRTLLLTNFVIWSISSVFTLQPWLWLLVVGMFVYISVVPFIEASEHTIIQKVVPHERQGRVFGFAQSMEMCASPFTAFLIGPLAQFIFIPFMTTGAGVSLIGDWFGTGADRGIALVFTLAGIIGLCVTLLAFHSKFYKNLSKKYKDDARETIATNAS